MSGESFTDSMYEELDKVHQEALGQVLNPAPSAPQGDVSDTAPSAETTPDPLNMAFINDQSQSNTPSQPQSQNTRAAASIIDCLLNTIDKHEVEPLDLHMPATSTTSTRSSPTALPKTPTMKSTGTMPKTPIMVSIGTMPRTPQMKSTGTMPKTPTMTSTGIMPRTPTTVSTGTMPKTPFTIDLVSPTTAIIDLCSPRTPPPPSAGPPH